MLFKNKFKGQISVEFLIIFILIFSIFLYALHVVNIKSNIVAINQENIYSQTMVLKTGELINQIYFSGNNTEKEFYLDLKDNYYFEVNNYTLYLVQENSNAKYSFNIFTNNVDFNNTEKNVLIKNVLGNIVIQNA